MAVNNIYYVDMEKRYLDYQNGAIDMRNLHPMVYDDRSGHNAIPHNNMAILREVDSFLHPLSIQKGRMLAGYEGALVLL